MQSTQETNIHDLALKLSLRKKDILFLLYRFRFLQSKHLQFLLSQKAHSRMRIWIAELKRQSIIGSISIPTCAQGRLPEVYYLETNGFRIINALQINTSSSSTLSHKEKIHFFLLHHALATADLAVLIGKYYKKNAVPYCLYTRGELDMFVKHVPIKPDLFLKIEDKAYFLEVDRETKSEYKMVIKMKNYLRFYANNSWHKFQEDLYPGIIFVSLSDYRQVKLQKLFEELLKQEGFPPIVIKFTTLNQIYNEGLTQNICTVSFRGTEQFLLL